MCYGSNSCWSTPRPSQQLGSPTAINNGHSSRGTFSPHQQSSQSTSTKVSGTNNANWRRRNKDQVVNNTTSAWRCSSSSSLCQSQNSRRPPHHAKSTWVWQPTVPTWEKQFCSKIGSVPWKKLLETKMLMPYYYENIVKWNDSAGEEAFNNAKGRFWAVLNGLTCDHIPPADPDMYIDEVDWNAEIDPELESDLDKRQLPSDDEDDNDNYNDVSGNVLSQTNESGNVWFQGDALYFWNNPVVLSVRGWGDAEDEEENPDKKDTC